MRTTPRAGAILALGAALALGPASAQAQQVRVPDPAGDSSSGATDLTRVRAQHAHDRIGATVLVPRLRPGRLSGTELLIRTKGFHKVYSVTILRDRQGRVREKTLGWRPLNDPVEPRRLPCNGIHTSLHERSTVVSIAKSCLSLTPVQRSVQVKVRTVDGTIGLQGAYWDDQSRYSRWLARGPRPVTDPQARVTAADGLVERGLPTSASGQRGRLVQGEVVPVVCQVAGSVVYRNDDENAERSNVWYRVAAAHPTWVSALYVEDIGAAPLYCGTGRTHAAKVTTGTLVRREAPTSRAAAHGAATRGDTVRAICKLHAQDVRGDDLWYNLPQGLWVSARYVADVGSAPPFCTRTG